MGKIWLFVLVACAALVLAGCIAGAPPPAPQVGNVNPVGVASWWGNWEWLAAGGLFLSLLVIGLVYMFASAFRSNELLAWCKVEIYQIAMTALVLGGFIGMVWFIASIDTSIIGLKCTLLTTATIGNAPLPEAGQGATIGTGGCNAFDLSMSYLKWMRERTWVIYNRFLLIYNKYGFQTSINYGAAMGGIGPVLQPMVWLQPVLGYTTMILNFVVTAILLIMVQIEVMRYIQYGMLNIVLPIGVVCRCFSPLRDFGGALMGIAIALFLFYPLTFALDMAVILPSTGGACDGPPVCHAYADQTTCMNDPTGRCTWFDQAYQMDELRIENMINQADGTCKGDDPLSTCEKFVGKDSCEGAPGCAWVFADQVDEKNLQELHNVMVRTNDGGANPRDAFAGLKDWWYKATVLLDGVALGKLGFNTTQVILGALLLPLMNFIIITTAAREFSRFLGEEIDVSNLTRII